MLVRINDFKAIVIGDRDLSVRQSFSWVPNKFTLEASKVSSEDGLSDEATIFVGSLNQCYQVMDLIMTAWDNRARSLDLRKTIKSMPPCPEWEEVRNFTLTGSPDEDYRDYEIFLNEGWVSVYVAPPEDALYRAQGVTLEQAKEFIDFLHNQSQIFSGAPFPQWMSQSKP